MQKIRRYAAYYTDRFKQNHWCERCYNKLKEDEKLKLDDGKETKKSYLIKLKNDESPEESWVQCRGCHGWCHDICALFNGTQKSKESSTYMCPQCHLKDLANRPVATSVKSASDLPHCNLSRSVEDGLLKTLAKEYEKVAVDRGCTVAQVEKAEGLSVRVVSSLEKKHIVRDGVSLIL